MNQNNSESSVIDRTFTEIIIVLLFTAYIVIFIMEIINLDNNRRIQREIFVQMDSEIELCRTDVLGTGVVSGTYDGGVRINASGPFFTVDENDNLSRTSDEVRMCIQRLCGAVLSELYRNRDSIERVFIEGYASPGYGREDSDQITSETGRACNSTEECNTIFSAIRAANVYQMCASELHDSYPEALKWFYSNITPAGMGVPDQQERERNIEFRIEFREVGIF